MTILSIEYGDFRPIWHLNNLFGSKCHITYIPEQSVAPPKKKKLGPQVPKFFIPQNNF